MSFTAISFDSHDLQSFSGGSGILVSNIQHAGKSAKRAQTYALSHANASQIPFVEYPSKPIEVSGKIIGTSIADCDNQIDLFNSYLLKNNGNLDIGYNGGTRRYIATATNINVDRPGGLLYANFDITFTCTQAFGQDVNPTTILNTSGRTSANYSDNYTFGGTAPYQQPVFTITYSSVSGATSKAVIIGNNSNSQEITVERTWSNGDVLVIDSSKSIVTVNGIAADFTGAFPLFAPGAQTITYSDGFSSRSFSVDYVYNVLYV
jgi:Siphovirus-type tail component, C-terminal domain